MYLNLLSIFFFMIHLSTIYHFSSIYLSFITYHPFINLFLHHLLSFSIIYQSTFIIYYPSSIYLPISLLSIYNQSTHLLVINYLPIIFLSIYISIICQSTFIIYLLLHLSSIIFISYQPSFIIYQSCMYVSIFIVITYHISICLLVIYHSSISSIIVACI